MIKRQKILSWGAFATLLFASLLGIPYAAKWLLSPPDKSEFRQPQTNAQRPPEPRSPQSPSTISRNSTASSNPTPASDPFRVWISEYSALSANSQSREEILQAGIALAKVRRPRMEQLIRENPRQALAEGLRFHEWAALPEEIKPEVEQPFSATADYSYLPICREPGTPRLPGEPDAITLISLQDGKTRSSFSYGMRANLMSKNSLPAQGIALGDLAAMREETFQIVEPAEEAAIQSLFPLGQLDATRSFASGEKVQDEPVLAVAGGRVYSFASEEEVQTLNHLFGELEALPGPFGAWGAFLASPSEFVTTEGSLDVPKIKAKATAQSSDSTLTKKRLFLIRINFPDRPEEPGTQAAAEEGMANASEIIREMSYGKTWVEAKASAKVYMMPKPFVYYTSNSTDKVAIEKDPAKNALFFGEMMRDARNAFRTNKNGEDSAINIGPVDQSFVGGSSGLGDYDIVGLRRIPLPIPGGEGGYASGSELFMTGDDERTFVHEFGHNYGLGHASLWKTNDGSITGNGYSEEYGDVFDVMGRGQVPLGHFHMQAKARLKWLPQTDWVDADLSGSGTYRVFRIDSKELSSGLRGVRIARGGNATANGYYWLGHRGALESNLNLSTGGYILWEKPGKNRSWLLDMTPESLGGAKDSSLSLCKTFADPLSGVFITPISKGGSGVGTYIDFRVNIGPFPNNSQPQASEIIGPTAIQARKTATFSISASDPNGDQLAYFWDCKKGTSEANPLLSSATFTGVWETGGTYELQLTISDMKGGTLTRTKQITVTDPLDNWSVTNVGKSIALMSAKSGNGLIVTAGYWGEMFHSWDGISWRKSQKVDSFENPRLGFGGGRFVAVGKKQGEEKAQIAFSDDGIIWEKAIIPDANTLRTVFYGGDKFVALGDLGTGLWSSDGMHWNKYTVDGNPDFRVLAWNGISWLAVATNPENDLMQNLWTSTDGITWTKGKTLGNSHSVVIIGHNGTFLFNTWGQGSYNSDNGGNDWAGNILPAGIDTGSVRQIAVSDTGVFLAHGIPEGNSDIAPIPLISINGKSWYASNSQSASEALSNPIAWFDGKTWREQIAFGAGRFVKIGNEGVVKYSEPLGIETNSTPAANEIIGPEKIEARKPAVFSVQASDADGDQLAYFWDSGESALEARDFSKTFHNAWETGGNYEMKVTVSDMKGGTVTKTKQITVTDPLDNWSTTSVGRSVTLLSAKSGNGLLVAAGYWGEIFYSWDGISWQESQTIPDMKESRLEFGAGQFVIVGKQHNDLKVKIAYSRDGRIWEAANAPDTPPPHDLAYGGGKFLAIGEQGSVLSSLDGINWNASIIPGNPEFRSLAWNGNSWLAYAATPELPNNVAAWISHDGVTWTKGNNLGNASAPVLAHNGVFLFNSWGKGIRRSVDAGMAFHSMPELLGVDSWTARHVAVSDNGVFFAHGHVSGEDGVPLISTDGVSWYQSNSQSAREALKTSGVWGNGKVWGDQVAYGAGRFIKVGFDGVVKYSQPLASSHSSPSITAATISGPFKSRGTQFLSANASASNGASLRYFWDFGQNLPVLEGKNASFILPFGGSYDVKLRAVDSTGAVSVSNQTLSLSDPALTFTKRESGATYFLAAIAANDSIAVAVGDANHAILTSTNGANWTKRTLPHWTYLHDIVWDGFKFIVLGHSWRNLGRGWEWHNVIHTSPDGSLWTERYLAPFSDNLHLRTLTAKPGGPALAGGDQGLFLRSADGLNWSPQTISALGKLTVRDMEWSGREFALVTSAPTPTQNVKLLTSPDGIQWTDRTSGNLVNTVWELSQLNGRLFATGWTGSNSKMRISLDDGRNFTFARLSENMEFPAMAYGGGIYFGAGFEHVSGYPNADVFSLNGNDWYSYESPTTKRRKDATYFKNTLITVGDDGEIWQSEPFTPVKDMLAIGELGFPLWDGSNSEVKHKFLGPPGQRRKLQFSPDLSQPWLDHGEIEFGQLGTLDATLRQSGDQRAKWNKKMFFRLLPAAEQ